MLLRVSAEAGADLDAIRLYGFEHYGDRAADAYLAALTRSFDRIAEWPLAARMAGCQRPFVVQLAIRGGTRWPPNYRPRS